MKKKPHPAQVRGGVFKPRTKGVAAFGKVQRDRTRLRWQLWGSSQPRLGDKQRPLGGAAAIQQGGPGLLRT